MIRRLSHLVSEFADGIRGAIAWGALELLFRKWNEMPTAAPAPRPAPQEWDLVAIRTALRGREIGVAYKVQSLVAGESDWVDATKPLESYREAENVVLVLERNREPGDGIAYRVVPIIDRSVLS